MMSSRSEGSSTLQTLKSIYSNPFQKYMSFSESIGGQIHEQSLAVENVFKATMELASALCRFKNPYSVLTEQNMITPLMDEIYKVKAFERTATEYVFQITLVCKSVEIFEWVNQDDTDKFVKNLNKKIQFHKQKAENEINELGRIHLEWLKSWNKMYEEISLFILSFFKNGICWTGSTDYPKMLNLGDTVVTQTQIQHEELLKEINRLDATNHGGLKRYMSLTRMGQPQVQQDITGHKNWRIEHETGNHGRLVLNTAQKEDHVILNDCKDCTVVIENVIKSIHVDECQKITILLRTATKVEILNSSEINLHCFEKIASIDLTSCDNVSLSVSDKSLDLIITTKKCVGVHVNFPFENGMYQHFTISDVMVTKIVPNKGIDTNLDKV